jgi:hypothetical protein
MEFWSFAACEVEKGRIRCLVFSRRLGEYQQATRPKGLIYCVNNKQTRHRRLSGPGPTKGVNPPFGPTLTYSTLPCVARNM